MKILPFKWASFRSALLRFFLSDYFSDALRNTLVIVIPVWFFFFLGDHQAALGIGTGALLISLTDLPGSRLQKYKTAISSLVVFFLTALIFTQVFFNPLYTAAAFLLLTFLFSMLSAFSIRAGLTGTMAIILSTFLMGLAPSEPLRFSFYILGGGCWYYLFSLVQISIWPYHSLNHAIAAYTRSTAELLRVKGRCYDPNESLDSAYQLIISLHTQASQKQDQLRSLVLSDQRMIKSSVRAKLMLAKVIKLIELYEQITAIHYDYRQIREELGPSGALPVIVDFIHVLADELEALGGSFLLSGKTHNNKHSIARVKILQAKIIRQDELTAQRSMLLKRIFKNLQDISSYILELYMPSTSPGHDIDLLSEETNDYQAFLPETKLGFREFRQLFSFKFPLFRFSVRLAISFLLAYGLIVWLGQQKYSYWMLLTIVIVARPKFGTTWKRNIERLSGTSAGLLVGLSLVFLITSVQVLLVLSAIFLLGFFAFNRLNYRISVAFITSVVILCLGLYHGHTGYIATERLFYTIAGCLIAFAGVYLFPVWERSQLKGYITAAVAANEHYLTVVLDSRKLSTSATQVKLARKNAHRSLACFSESLQFVVLEPGKNRFDLQAVYLIQTLIFRINSAITSVLLATHQEDITDQTDFLKQMFEELADQLELSHFWIKS